MKYFSFSIAAVHLVGMLILAISPAVVLAKPNQSSFRVSAEKFSVEAHSDQTEVVLPVKAMLWGVLKGEKPANVTVRWEIEQGPGQVQFEPGNTLETYAAFSDPGAYTILLTVTDRFGSVISDKIRLTVHPLNTEIQYNPTLSFEPLNDPGYQVAYHDNYIYQSYFDYIKIYRVSGPRLTPTLTEVATIDGNTPRPASWNFDDYIALSAKGIAYLDGYLYLAMNIGSRMEDNNYFCTLMVDVRDPARPEFTGRDSNRTSSHNVFPVMIDRHVYLFHPAFGYSGNHVTITRIDTPNPSIENPARISLVYQFPYGDVTDGAHSVEAHLYTSPWGEKQWRMYVSGWTEGLLIYDVSDLATDPEPKPLAQYLYGNSRNTHASKPFPVQYLNGYSSAVIVTDESGGSTPVSVINTEAIDARATFGQNIGTINCRQVGQDCYLAAVYGDRGYAHWFGLLNNVLAVGMAWGGSAIFIDMADGPDQIRQLTQFNNGFDVFSAKMMREYPDHAILSDKQLGLQVIKLNRTVGP